MRRVELKGDETGIGDLEEKGVPNAPCGVESLFLLRPHKILFGVFLMRRVELKELKIPSLS